jgi:hypothetical protein
MKSIKSMFNRRYVLRGMLGGAAVTVGLPVLNCFLNNSGTAFANGSPLPVRFGTWFWGLGMNKAVFTPKTIGPNYDLPEEMASWEPVKQHINVFSGYRVLTDGRPNLCHFSGWVGIRCGQAPVVRGDSPNESMDVTVADRIGGGTRFRSITCAATGSPHDSYSFRSADAVNPPEVSEIDFYQRIFGPEFQDPNSPNFTPDPRIMMRKSVLSSVMDQSKKIEAYVDGEDRARLDQYYTSIRELEQRFALQLQKPPPAEACVVPKGPGGKLLVSMEQEVVANRHRLMTDTLVLALACNQTRVFNMLYSNGMSNIMKKGDERTHHIITHEEAIDPVLGYQPTTSWFIRRSMEEWTYFVKALAGVKEGDGTVLDHSIVFAHSDQSLAKYHQIDGIPMMTAGRAGGRIKTGIHVAGDGAPVTQVTLTVMQAAGLSIGQIGSGSMTTSKVVSEVLA